MCGFKFSERLLCTVNHSLLSPTIRVSAKMFEVLGNFIMRKVTGNAAVWDSIRLEDLPDVDCMCLENCISNQSLKNSNTFFYKKPKGLNLRFFKICSICSIWGSKGFLCCLVKVSVMKIFNFWRFLLHVRLILQLYCSFPTSCYPFPRKK